ncbi:MAG: type II secretion system F family protein [Patescibacteria group bacterium]
MPKFNVKVINKRGGIESRSIDTISKVTLYEEIRRDGGKLISAKEVSEFGLQEILNRIDSVLSRIKLQDKIMFARNIAAMLSAGLALSRAIIIMERQTKNKKFKIILRDMNEEISKGSTFSQALSKYPNIFSKLLVSMVKAGEETGSLADSLLVVSDEMEKSYMLQKKIKGAMIYPAIIMTAMVGIGILMMIYVVPSLTSTFKELNVELPTSTKLIISVSDFLQTHTILFIISLIGGILGIIGISHTQKGSRLIDYITPRFPIVGTIVQESYAARTSRTLSSLLSAGVEVITALSITKDVLANSFYKEVLSEAEKAIQKGAPLSEVFLKHEEIYPVLVGEMMSVGDETGSIADMLLKLAVFYENEVDQKTKDLSTVIEPFLMLFIGSAVGFFAIAMISPTYSVLTNI